MEDTVKKVTELIKSNKTIMLIILALIGILMITAGGMFQKSDEDKEKDVFDEKVYIEDLEKRIGEMVSSIKGAGESRVVINIISTTESVYVKENKKSYDSSSEKSKSETEDSVLTMTDSSGNEYALVTKQIMPQIGGVTVVCDGGEDATVKASVINAVCTVLNIGANKVCVIAKAN
ncbi:MAG: hypothetical protein J6K66_05900 [Clostridia bacterium]|nr:hypothetical protein [Clostridia bacterium]